MPGQSACPRCNAGVAAGAQFCGSCGAPLGAAPPPPPQPMPHAPPPPMPQIPQMPRGFTGGATGGVSKQATFSGSAQDAYNQAIAAINAANAASNGAIASQITWQQPPASAKFETVCKSFWSTAGFAIKYDGDLTVQPAGPGQVTARYALKVQWGSAMGLIITQGLAVIIAAMVNPYIFAFALFFILGAMGFTAWNVSSGLPERALTQFMKHLQGGGAVAPAPAFTPAAPAYTPQPATSQPTPVAAAPVSAAPPASDATAIMDQIKQLAGLRDAGALTPEEFEAKKAELLKRI